MNMAEAVSLLSGVVRNKKWGFLSQRLTYREFEAVTFAVAVLGMFVEALEDDDTLT